MKVLLVEDAPFVAQALKRGLKRDYLVDIVASGSGALKSAGKSSYDIILLDLNLPDIPGLDVCRTLRRRGTAAPILVLTGSIKVQDKVSLLDAGADDYISKPYSLEEVKARMRAALRRASFAATAAGTLQVGDLQLDPAGRTAYRGDQPISVRRKEFEILEYLIRNQGKTVTRSMVYENIWGDGDGLWTNTVDVHIKHLRDKVDRPFDTPLIKTVHGVGYKLEAPAGDRVVTEQ